MSRQAVQVSQESTVTPSSWSNVALKDTAQSGHNNFVDGDWIEAPFITSEGIRLIQTGNIGIGKFLNKPANARYISEQTFKLLRCKWVYPGDILICRLAEPIGRACRVPNYVGRSITSVDCTIYRPDPQIVDRNYIIHLLNSPESLRSAEDVAGGSTRQRISRSALGALQANLPSLAEQRRIAEILDTLDRRISTGEQIIAKLKLTEQGLLDYVFRVRAVKWKSSRLSHITSKITDGTHQAVITEDTLVESVPFLYVSSVRDGQINWQSAGKISQATYADISKGRRPKSGMVLYTAVGSYGHAAVVRRELSFGFQRHIACIYPNEAKVSGDFIAAFLNSSVGKLQSDRMAVGNAQKTVTLSALGDFEMPVPELPEQQEIVNVLSAAEGRIAANQRSLAKLHLIKRGVMSDLLTGRVRVSARTRS